ncbi:hypothetical protein [uncultured Winogradskyella sp.]|uniref:hypothetical protein n=1 Tax=uncultured Winogradskyella sp. TaxID=395353 RepID=UPI00262FD34B|nr:hypothetical protein [uncultured Winogradskyella sp.]
MSSRRNVIFFNYSIPCLAIIVIVIQMVVVKTQNLSKWKGGGYGMYSEIHYFYNQIHIPNLSVDSLVDVNSNLKNSLGYLMLMPNDNRIKESAQLILETTKNDSISVQLWKPVVDSKKQSLTRVLVNEIQLNNGDL